MNKKTWEVLEAKGIRLYNYRWEDSLPFTSSILSVIESICNEADWYELNILLDAIDSEYWATFCDYTDEELDEEEEDGAQKYRDWVNANSLDLIADPGERVSSILVKYNKQLKETE